MLAELALHYDHGEELFPSDAIVPLRARKGLASSDALIPIFQLGESLSSVITINGCLKGKPRLEPYTAVYSTSQRLSRTCWSRQIAGGLPLADEVAWQYRQSLGCTYGNKNKIRRSSWSNAYPLKPVTFPLPIACPGLSGFLPLRWHGLKTAPPSWPGNTS